MSYTTEINEPISVWVFFDYGIFPIAIKWRKKLIKFRKLIFVSSKKIGQTKILNLICASESANFELEYNGDDYQWKLKKVMPRE